MFLKTYIPIFNIVCYNFIKGNKMKIRVKLKNNERKALMELKKKLFENLPVAEVILYGSKVREERKGFSDIDVLVILNGKVSNFLEEKVFNTAYDMELKYNVVFDILAESKSFWNSELANAMPFHWNIDREGVPV